MNIRIENLSKRYGPQTAVDKISFEVKTGEILGFLGPKFLSTLLLVTIALAFTIPYAITVSTIGNMDAGQVLCGYTGLLLMSAMYTSIGLYASSTTTNQIVAFLTAMFTGLFFHIIFGMLAQQFSGWTGRVFEYLSLSSHFESISRGYSTRVT